MQNDPKKLDLVWGAREIGAVLGTNEPRTYALLSSGLIPAKRVGRTWCANRSELLAFFTMTPAASKQHGGAK